MTVRRVTTCTVQPGLDEYLEPFKGTVRTPSIASGHGYHLQTAHPELRCYDRFARKQTNPPTVTRSGRTVISSISTVLYAGVYLDARLSSPAGVSEVQVLQN